MQMCSISVSAALYNQLKSSYYKTTILLQSTKTKTPIDLSALIKQVQVQYHVVIDISKENDTCSIPRGLFAVQYVRILERYFESRNMDFITSRVEWCVFRCTNKWLTLDLHSYSSQSMAGWLLCCSHTTLARYRTPNLPVIGQQGKKERNRERPASAVSSRHLTLRSNTTRADVKLSSFTEGKGL